MTRPVDIIAGLDAQRRRHIDQTGELLARVTVTREQFRLAGPKKVAAWGRNYGIELVDENGKSL